MSKHTPGPWQVNHRHPAQVCDSDGEVRGCAPIAVTRGTAAECCANARLIAAAPEQHEACKVSLLVLCALRDANDWHPNMIKDIDFAIQANRAAIAKAKGEA